MNKSLLQCGRHERLLCVKDKGCKMNHKLNKPIVINYPDSGEWVVSFSNHNPSDDECFVARNKDEAFKLKNLIDSFIDMEFKRICPNLCQ